MVKRIRERVQAAVRVRKLGVINGSLAMLTSAIKAVTFNAGLPRRRSSSAAGFGTFVWHSLSWPTYFRLKLNSRD